MQAHLVKWGNGVLIKLLILHTVINKLQLLHTVYIIMLMQDFTYLVMTICCRELENFIKHSQGKALDYTRTSDN